MPDTNTLPIQCPNCGNQFQTPVRSVIDVGQQPQLRQAFLSGQINVAVCPKCQTGGVLDVPLVYHDPAAEFLAVYFPQQLRLPEMEKQRMIGELTQSLMRSLPPEQRKGYFLSPRQFVTHQSLMDAVLGTMGISQEELDRQRKKMKLVDQFMVMADDPKGLKLMLKGNEAHLDQEFFSIVAGMHQQAAAAGDAKAAERLRLLQQNLMPLTEFGRRFLKQQAALESLKEVQSPEAFLERVLTADADELSVIAVAARPLLDYEFFQKLTERIDAAQGAEQTRLIALREELLGMAQELDKAAQQNIADGVALLQEIINSPNPRSALREHAAEVDEVFMNVLAANIQRADEAKDEQLLARLEMVYDEVAGLVEESYPPEVRLVNELLRQPYPEGTKQMLLDRREEFTPELLDLIAQMAEDMSQREGAEAAEIAKRLRDVRSQAMLMV